MNVLCISSLFLCSIEGILVSRLSLLFNLQQPEQPIVHESDGDGDTDSLAARVIRNHNLDRYPPAANASRKRTTTQLGRIQHPINVTEGAGC